MIFPDTAYSKHRKNHGTGGYRFRDKQLLYSFCRKVLPVLIPPVSEGIWRTSYIRVVFTVNMHNEDRQDFV
jgi:hypothetical protein